jgi:hypothetical protein
MRRRIGQVLWWALLVGLLLWIVDGEPQSACGCGPKHSDPWEGLP